jgi:hypothetical protein
MQKKKKIKEIKIIYFIIYFIKLIIFIPKKKNIFLIRFFGLFFYI